MHAGFGRGCGNRPTRVGAASRTLPYQGMPKWFDVARQIAKLHPAYAQNWEGWQLNLKPAHEPAVLAQKPISENTYAANILRWGVGALNAEACRSPFATTKTASNSVRNFSAVADRHESVGHESMIGAGQRHPPGTLPGRRGDDGRRRAWPRWPCVLRRRRIGQCRSRRKASQRERTCEGAVENHHPTVKPVGPLRWMIRLITPVGGTCSTHSQAPGRRRSPRSTKNATRSSSSARPST